MFPVLFCATPGLGARRNESPCEIADIGARIQRSKPPSDMAEPLQQQQQANPWEVVSNK